MNYEVLYIIFRQLIRQPLILIRYHLQGCSAFVITSEERPSRRSAYLQHRGRHLCPQSNDGLAQDIEHEQGGDSRDVEAHHWRDLASEDLQVRL